MSIKDGARNDGAAKNNGAAKNDRANDRAAHVWLPFAGMKKPT